MKINFFIFCSFLLFSCGGGSSNQTSIQPTVEPTIPTYSYTSFQEFYAATTLDDITAKWNNFSDNNLALNIRKNASEGYCVFLNEGIQFSFSPVSESDFKVGFQQSAKTGTGACSGANVSSENLQFNASQMSSPTYDNLDGVYSGYLERLFSWNIGKRGSDPSEQVVFKASSLINETDGVVSYWSGTSYSSPEVVHINYGDSCLYDGEMCLGVNADNTYNTDLIASTSGDRTEVGDMKGGTASYKLKGLAIGVYGFSDFLNQGAFTSFSSGCGSNPQTFDCEILSIYSISDENVINVVFGASKSVNGPFNFLKHYVLGSLEEEVTGSSITNALSNLYINATIGDGNSISGTIENDNYDGQVSGHFYGPKSQEIGLSMILTYKPSGSFSDSNMSFVVISATGDCFLGCNQGQ